VSPAIRAGLAIVAVAGLAAGLLVMVLPRVMASGRLIRFRIARWIGVRVTSNRDAWKAALLIFASWTLRATALYLLLAAMHIELSYPLAIGFLCAGAAAGALPITPAAGAATTVGGGAALLIASGVGTPTAVDFAISAQTLLIFAGIAIVLYAAILHGGQKLVTRRRAAHA
jgi:hypothetical protein